MKSSCPPLIVFFLLQAAVLLLFSISCSAAEHGWKPSDLPSPQKDLGKVCGRNGIKSAVCTPDGLLSGSDADALDGLINFIAEGTNGYELAKCGSRVEGYQIAVAIINKMDPWFDMFDSNEEKAKRFAKDLHDSWGVGDAECQNGVVLFVAVEDRVMYISTGRGTKQVLTDGRVHSILRQMRPLMREEQYGRALLAAVERIGLVLSHKAPKDSDNESTWVPFFFGVLFAPFSLFMCLSGIISARRRREKYRRCRDALRRIDEDSERARNNNYQSSSCPICLEEFEPATPVVEPDSAKALSSSADTITDSPENENDSERTPLFPKQKQTSSAESASAEPSPKVILPCGHSFHTDCVEQWYTSGNGTNRENCPVCRRPIDGENEELRSDMNAFQDERRFRIRRTHDIYPEYISYSLMNRFERDRNARLETHVEFARLDPRLMDQARSAGAGGSSFSFGGGSSRGGGGGGSSW